MVKHGRWLTVDKYGDPDLKADLEGPATVLPFGDESVDLLLCTEVLEHLRSGSALVSEFARVLKPEGRAIISVPNIASMKSRFAVLRGGLPHLAASGDCGPPLGGTGLLDGNEWVAGHVVDFNESRLVGYLNRNGLEVTDHASVPFNIGNRIRTGGYVVGGRLPRRWLDYLLVAATPQRKGLGAKARARGL